MTDCDGVRARAVGAFLGLAVGDALDATLELKRRDSRSFLAEILGGRPFEPERGASTGNIAMALCLAESLIVCDDFDDRDVMARFVRWRQTGESGSTRPRLDIDTTRREATARDAGSRNTAVEGGDPRSAGSRSLMRLVPVVIGANSRDRAVEWARRQSALTDETAEARDACAYYAGLLYRAIAGEPREQILALDDWRGEPAIATIVAGSWKIKRRQDIGSTGHVVDTLEAALWSAGGARSFEDALQRAINLADHSDTVGAVTGQLAGALWSVSAIPSRWLERLDHRDELVAMVGSLLAMRDRLSIEGLVPPPI